MEISGTLMACGNRGMVGSRGAIEKIVITDSIFQNNPLVISDCSDCDCDCIDCD